MRAVLLLGLLAISTLAWADGEHKAEMARRVKERFEAQFKAADTDGNGKLSRAEVEKSMPYVAKNFDVIDADKDGSLSIEEISAHDEIKNKRSAEAK